MHKGTTSSPIVLASEVSFPEGPAFAPDRALWCVEQHGESLIKIDQGAVARHHVGGRPNGLTITKDGLLWFCDSGLNAIRTYCPRTGKTEILVSHINNLPLHMPNDLAFDLSRNLVFTCPGPSLGTLSGYVCTWSQEKGPTVIAENMDYPNGLAFTADYSRLLIAETGTHRIWIGDWDAERTTWTNPRIFAHTGGPIGPDGFALDEHGNVYVAVYGSGTIKAYDQEGSYLDEIKLPGKNPTNCAFDPSGKLGLVVTEAERGEIVRFPMDCRGIMHRVLGL